MCIDVDDHAVFFVLKAYPLDVRAIVIELHRDLHVMPPPGLKAVWTVDV